MITPFEINPVKPYCEINVDDLRVWITFVTEQLKNSRCKALARKSEYCGETWIYRGQGNSEWEITSTLQREVKIDPTNIMSYERDMRGKELAAIQNFKALAWKYVPDPKMTYLEWLMLMRHYGVPTRLVDFTESPAVALHFAVETEPTSDFAVWAINRDRFRDAYIQSQVGTKLPGWDELSKTYGERVMEEIRNLNSCDPLVKKAQRHLDNFILSEATTVMRNMFNRDLANTILSTPLSNEPTLPDKMGVLWFTPERPSSRMVAQKGLFLMPLRFSESLMSLINCTFEMGTMIGMKEGRVLNISETDILNRLIPNVSIIKFIFKQEMISEVNDFLLLTKCSSFDLYPDMDGIAASITKQIHESMSGYVGSLSDLKLS